MAESIPERLTIETEALALQRPRPRSGMLGLAAFGLFLLPIVIMMVGGGIFGMDKPASWSSILGGSWLSALVMTMVAGVARAREMPTQGRVVIEDGALTLAHGNASESWPRGAVVGGSVTPQIRSALLTLSLDDGRVATAFVPSEAAGARALEALRIDPLGRALVGRFRSGFLRGFAGFGVGLGLCLLGGWLKNAIDLSTSTGLVWLALCLTFIVSWLIGTRPPEIAVGADGVRIRGKTRARFIALDDIESAKVEGIADTLVLGVTGGTEERIRVPLGNGPMLAAVAHRIELAKKATRAGADAAALLSVISRGARTFTAWREHLRNRIRRADYRHASLEGGELEQLVGSPGASAEQRIGAAIALREAGGDEARGRIRIAAEQCVEPRVRVALERIAEEAGQAEEEAVEAALVGGAPAGVATVS